MTVLPKGLVSAKVQAAQLAKLKAIATSKAKLLRPSQTAKRNPAGQKKPGSKPSSKPGPALTPGRKAELKKLIKTQGSGKGGGKGGGGGGGGGGGYEGPKPIAPSPNKRSSTNFKLPRSKYSVARLLKTFGL